MLSIKSPGDMALELAKRLRQQRLAYAWTQVELAERAGVTVASLKRFETTGEISLIRLLQLCFTLHAIDDFEMLLREPVPKTMVDIEKQRKKRKRGKRKST